VPSAIGGVLRGSLTKRNGVAGATHFYRCHPLYSASEPNVRVLTVGRIARHPVQADRLPGALQKKPWSAIANHGFI
jgi:hypothetical protein